MGKELEFSGFDRTSFIEELSKDNLRNNISFVLHIQL